MPSLDGGVTWHWPGGGPDPRLVQEMGELECRLNSVKSQDQQRDVHLAVEFLKRAACELDQHWADNQNGWVWFHAARRKALSLRLPAELALLEIDLRQESKAKLVSWRRDAVKHPQIRAGHHGPDVGNRWGRFWGPVSRHTTSADQFDFAHEYLLDHVVRLQRHLDETADNDNRKRILQHRQLVIYLAFLVVVLLAICLLEFLGRGLILNVSGEDGWWVISSVLYGTLGGAFSSAQRVATARPTSRYPELRWAQLANVFRPMAGGAGALVAFAALQAGLLGTTVAQSGPRVAVISFVAGFSERFIPSLAAQQEQST